MIIVTLCVFNCRTQHTIIRDTVGDDKVDMLPECITRLVEVLPTIL